MKATFSAADWQAVALGIADALTELILSAKPTLSSADVSTTLESAATRLKAIMSVKVVSRIAIENTAATIGKAFERRLNVLEVASLQVRPIPKAINITASMA